MSRVRLRDVAELAGVSIKTVSNVVNDYPYIRPQTRQRVEAAIDELGSPRREIVVLRLQGWKGVEIAELLGMSPGAVRVAQHRAYGRLRESLGDLGPGTENGASS